MQLLTPLVRHPRTIFMAHLALLLLVSGMVLGSFLHFGVDGYKRAMLQDSIDGTAHRPFVYRALVPFVVRTSTDIVPAAWRDRINAGARELFRNEDIREKIPLARVDYTSFAILLVIWYLSLVGFGLTLVRFLSAFYRFSAPFVYSFSLLGIAGLPALFTYYNYIYDLPQIFLFTLSLVLLARRRWLAYLILLALTTLNKETSVLLILVYVLFYYGKLGRRFWGLLAVQSGLFIAIKLALSAIFRASPGGMVEFHLGHNLFLPSTSIAQFAAFILIIVVIAHDWHNKPEFARCALAMLVPLLALNFFFGLLEEYRDYYEVYPVVLILCAHSIASVLGQPTTLRTPGAPTPDVS